MNALALPGTRLFLALWGGLAVVVVSRALPDQLLLLAVLLVLVAHGQSAATALSAAVIVALVDNGFVVNQAGQLAWTSATEVARTVLLLVVGLAAAEAHR